MKYFVVFLLIICMLGISSVLAAQATATQIATKSTRISNGETFGRSFSPLEIFIPKYAVKYFMPIELLGFVSGEVLSRVFHPAFLLSEISAMLFVFQLLVALFPLFIVLQILHP